MKNADAWKPRRLRPSYRQVSTVSKCQTDAVTSDETTKIKDWLNKQGYPLEFATATAIRRSGLMPEQGIHVQIEGKPREIDVYAEQGYRMTEL